MVLVAATEQVHVHEQRAAADDLDELTGATRGATTATTVGASAETPRGSHAHEIATAPAAVNETRQRRPRDEACGCHRRCLNSRCD